MSRINVTWNPLAGDQLQQPLRWAQPSRIRLAPDIFSPEVEDYAIAQVFAVMDTAKSHQFLVCTEHTDRMRDWSARVDTGCEALARDFMEFPDPTGRDHHYDAWPIPHVWLGVLLRNQQDANTRVPLILETTAAIRFAECIPQGHINLADIMVGAGHIYPLGIGAPGGRFSGHPRLDWITARGEKDPVHPDWLRSIREQCWEAKLPFRFEHWGAYSPYRDEIGGCPDIWMTADGRTQSLDDHGELYDGLHVVLLKRMQSGQEDRDLDGWTWDQYPEEKPSL